MCLTGVVFDKAECVGPVRLACNILGVEGAETAVLGPVEISGVTYDVIPASPVSVPTDAGHKVAFELHPRSGTSVLRYTVTVQYEEVTVETEPLGTMPLNL